MKKGFYISYFLFLVIILGIPLVLKDPYFLGILVQVGFFSLIAMGLSLLMGYAGQISLGHAAFFAIGAYTSAILTGTYGWSGWLAIPAGMVLAAIVAFIVGTPALKLKGHYLAMATLGFGEIVHIFISAEVELTGGPSGYLHALIPYLKIGEFQLDNEFKYYYFTWAIVLVILLLTLHLINSRIGRALKSIHSDPEAARSLGINVARYKVQIFVLSAVFASIAGSLYCHFILFVAPGPFGLMESVLLVTMVIIGGVGSIWGAIAGAALLTILPEVLRTFNDYNILVYGGILLFIMLFVPGGIFGGLQSLWKGLLKKIQSRRVVKDG
mgnify:CR=1 FL=1